MKYTMTQCAIAALEQVPSEDGEGSHLCYSEQGLSFIRDMLGTTENEEEFRQGILDLLSVSEYLLDNGHHYAHAPLSEWLFATMTLFFTEMDVKMLLEEASKLAKQDASTYKDVLGSREEIFEDPNEKKEGAVNAQDLVAQLQGKMRIGR